MYRVRMGCHFRVKWQDHDHDFLPAYAAAHALMDDVDPHHLLSISEMEKQIWAEFPGLGLAYGAWTATYDGWVGHSIIGERAYLPKEVWRAALNERYGGTALSALRGRNE